MSSHSSDQHLFNECHFLYISKCHHHHGREWCHHFITEHWSSSWQWMSSLQHQVISISSDYISKCHHHYVSKCHHHYVDKCHLHGIKSHYHNIDWSTPEWLPSSSCPSVCVYATLPVTNPHLLISPVSIPHRCHHRINVQPRISRSLCRQTDRCPPSPGQAKRKTGCTLQNRCFGMPC